MRLSEISMYKISIYQILLNFWNELFQSIYIPRQNSYFEKLYQKYGLCLLLDHSEAMPIKSKGLLE